MRTNTTPSFPSNSALTRGTRVLMSAGYLAAASATQDELGTIADTTLSTDTMATIIPINESGVKQFVASAAITQYATVYAAASGKITSTPGTLRRGIALEAASGDGAIIPVLVQHGSAAAL